MKLLILLALYPCIVLSASYYFSSTLGNDARTNAEAKDPNTPWKSITKLNSIFSTLVANDNVYFKRGDTFYGQILVTKSGTVKW